MRAHLESQVDAVNQIKFVKVSDLLDTEEVTLIQRSISTSKGLGKSRELAFDKFLNACIFNDI